MEVGSIQSTTQLKSTSRYPSCCVDKQPYGDHRAWVSKKRNRNVGSLAMSRVSRRLVVKFMGFNSMVLYVGVALGAPNPMVEMKEPRTLKLPSGVQFEEIVEGEGPKAQEGDLVQINYACRRYNGYFVHSTVDQFSGESTPVVLPLVDKQDQTRELIGMGSKQDGLYYFKESSSVQAVTTVGEASSLALWHNRMGHPSEKIIQGLKEVLIGMRAGGKRRALIPPSVGYISESLQPIPEEFGPRRKLLSHVNESLVFEIQLLKVL